MIETYADMLKSGTDIRWVIPNKVNRGAFGGLFGPPGSYKTMTAIAMGAGVASGVGFAGIAVPEPMPVLYIAAEGAAAFAPRVSAWCAGHGRDDPGDMRFLRAPVAMHDTEAVDELLAALDKVKFRPELVFLDTYAASVSAGYNENDSAHATQFAAGCRRLQRALAPKDRPQDHAALVALMHTGWGTVSRERGSSVIRGAVDVMLSLEPVGQNLVRLSVAKARDFAPPEPLVLEAVPVEDSLVMRRTTRSAVRPAGQLKLLAALHDSPKALRPKEWLDRTGIGKSQFYELKAELVRDQLVAENSSGGWHPTALGLAALQQQSADSPPESDRTAGVPRLGVRSGLSGTLCTGLPDSPGHPDLARTNGRHA